MVQPFTAFRDVSPEGIHEVIDRLTEDEWDRLERGYIDRAATDISDWWRPMLHPHNDVDPALLFCKLYHRSLARGEVRP